MSLFPDLTPLINQIKEFNTNQLRTNSLLEAILKEIQSSRRMSIVEDQLKNK